MMQNGLILVLLMTTIDATTLNITNAVRRHVRSLSYPEESEMGIFFALAIPLDDPLSTYAMSVAFFFEANYKLPTKEDTDLENFKAESRRQRAIDRATVYSILESKLESIGYPGRQCLLRSICETARASWNLNAGVLGDILRILFTPSMSRTEADLSSEYAKAEKVDATTRECSEIYSTCKHGIYDYITLPYQDL